MEEANDITYKELYTQLKAIFDGCDTIMDANHFGCIYIKKYPHMKNIILSYMNGRTYKDTINVRTKQTMMYDVHMRDNRDDALEAISKLVNKTTDDVYRKTLERIAYRKDYRKNKHKNVGLYNDSHSVKNVSKKCPHCSHVLNMPENTQYVICGYHNPVHGYDWNGCGRDWCFECNKMLCKRWETHGLHLQMNRSHDEECCSKHARENGNKYPDDYCQCNNNMILINSLIK
jgi:hypothetical protein